MCFQLINCVLLCPTVCHAFYFKLLCCPFICLFISFSLYLSFARVSFSTIASNPAGIPQALWTRGRRLHRSEDLIDGQPVFHSLPPVTRRKPKRRSVSEQRLSEQWVTSSEDYRTEVSITAIETDIPVRQMDQQNTSGIEALMRQMQESMR